MATSFEELNKEELLAVAEMFAVDAKATMAKAAIIKELAEMGVDYGTYQALLQKDAEVGVPEELAILQEPETETVIVPVAVEVPVDEVPDAVVVKMTRENVRWDSGPYSFTREHPYVLMPEEHAERIFATEEGFRIATPKELREFYAK